MVRDMVLLATKPHLLCPQSCSCYWLSLLVAWDLKVQKAVCDAGPLSPMSHSDKDGVFLFMVKIFFSLVYCNHGKGKMVRANKEF